MKTRVLAFVLVVVSLLGFAGAQTADQQYETARQSIQSIVQPSLDALAAYKAAVEARVADLQGQIAAKQATIDSLNAQLANATSSDSTDKQTIAALQAQVANLTGQVSSLQTQLATAQQQLADAQTQLASAQAKLALVSPAGMADMNLHGDWKANFGTDQKIGPWDPGASYYLKQMQYIAGSRYAMELHVQGVSGTYSDILWAVSRRQLPAGDGRIILAGRIYTDSNAPLGAQAIEIDTEVVKGGVMYNLSGQINYYKGGMVQWSDPNGLGWQDTNIIVGKLTPGVWHTFSFEYSVDYTAQTHTYIAFTLDGKRYLFPAAAQNLPGVACNWGEMLHPQLQLDTNSKGIGYSVWYSDLDYYFPGK